MSPPGLHSNLIQIYTNTNNLYCCIYKRIHQAHCLDAHNRLPPLHCREDVSTAVETFLATLKLNTRKTCYENLGNRKTPSCPLWATVVEQCSGYLWH